MSLEKARLVTLKGFILSCSHVFYLSGFKGFLIEILDESKARSVLIVPSKCEKFKTFQTKSRNFLGVWIQVTRVLRMQADFSPHPTFRITSKSTFEEKKSLEPENEEVHQPVEGIITDDTEAEHGIYTLSKRFKLVATSICHLTNIRRFQKGQRVVLSNYHLIPKSSVIVLCAKSFARSRDEDYLSVHHKEDMEAFGRNELVLQALKLHCHYADVFQMVKFVQRLRRLDLKVSSNLQKFLKFTNPKIFNRTRSLLNEFCHHPDYCGIINSPEMLADTVITTLSTLGEEYRPKLKHSQEEKKKSYSKVVCQVHRDQISMPIADSVLLMGRLSVNGTSGLVQLEDETGTMPILLDIDPNVEFLNQHVMIKGVLACLEWIKCSHYGKELFYIKIQSKDQIEIMESTTTDLTPAPESQTGFRYQVMDCGIPFGFDTVYVFCTVYDEGQKTRKLIRFSLESLQGFQYLPSGCVITSDLESRRVQVKNGELFSSQLNVQRVEAFPSRASLHFDFSRVRNSSQAIFRLEELEGITNNEIVNLEAFLIDIRMEEEQNRWPKLQLRLSPSPARGEKIVSCYLTDFTVSGFQFGVLPNQSILLRNVKKVTSKKGNHYFAGTLITVIQSSPNGTFANSYCATDLVTLMQLSSPDCQRNSITTTLTVEGVLKVSLTAICRACNTMMSESLCQYVGCHANANLESTEKAEFILKCLIKVEDFTAPASLFISSLDDMAKLFKLNESEVSMLKLYSKDQSEYFYPGKTLPPHCNEEMRAIKIYFDLIFDLMPKTERISFKCRVRKFEDSNQKDQLKLFCISVI